MCTNLPRSPQQDFGKKLSQEQIFLLVPNKTVEILLSQGIG